MFCTYTINLWCSHRNIELKPFRDLVKPLFCSGLYRGEALISRCKWNRKRHWNGFHPRKLAGFASHHRRTISVPVHWTPKFTLFSYNTSERPCISRSKCEHKMTFQFIWLVGRWTVYSEWMMQRNSTRGNFQMDSATGVKVWVVDFWGKLVSVVVIIKWTFMTSWYDL